jgi:ribA/ribD-fused uncharacterized protein
MNDAIQFEQKLNAALAKRLNQLNSIEQFTFFWETRSPFSQWYKIEFTAAALDLNGTDLPDAFSGPLKFSSAEQFMMLHKALLFEDYETAYAIHQTKNVREQKSLGRLIKKFDDSKWQMFRAFIVYNGNTQKFSQNAKIRNELISTQGTAVVEAAPDDAIWGIGLVKEDPRAWKRETWTGTNLLGEILTYIRIELTGKY